MVTDAGEGVTPADRDLYGCLRHKDPLVVVNKIDLLGDTPESDPPAPWPEGSEVPISAKYNEGIPGLHQAISERVLHGMEGLNGERLLPNLRQKESMEKASDSVRRAIDCIEMNAGSFELAAIDLGEARAAVGEVLGLRAADDVLDQIFSRFCIGK
jgi:tRNA modification GTPase